jgi:K+-transporting ATPase ATPase A chain
MVQGFLQIAIFCALIVAVVPLLGGHMARVFRGERTFIDPVAAPMERFTYRLLRIDPERGQDWKVYARSVILFSLAGWLVLFLILRTQTLHPWNPDGFHSGTWDLSFNTASSFVTNTNWQYYGGETTLSYFSQMAGLTVHNFVSAATGIAVAIALIRGIIEARKASQEQRPKRCAGPSFRNIREPIRIRQSPRRRRRIGRWHRSHRPSPRCCISGLSAISAAMPCPA